MVIGCFLAPMHAASQVQPVTGLVTDSLTGSPIRGARVIALGDGGGVAGRSETDSRGEFRIPLREGSYSFTVIFVGHAPWQADHIEVPRENGEILRVQLIRRPAVLGTITVVSRDERSILEAPAAASLIELANDNGIALSPAEHLEQDPGIVVSRKGLTQSTFSARGPGAANSAALLVLHDYRLASVPSLRLNVPYLIPASEGDLDRIEITRGPSSVVYGADADRGVVNFITRSPFNSRGTTVTTTAGGRSVYQIGLRHAGLLSQRVGFKFSGDYFGGTDWPTNDPADSLRDSRIKRVAGEVRLDWLAGDSTTVVFSGGLAQAINNVDLTEVGSIQVKDWRYTFGQVRLRHTRLFLNAFLNQNDAGHTFRLNEDKAPVVDDSRALSVQLQYGSTLGRTDLSYGVDVQRVIPRTHGTIHGRNETRDNITLAGAYLSSTTRLSRSANLVGSLRADHHDQLDDLALSPRLGIVLKPADDHAIRLTWNRATSTPVANDLFLDFQESSNLRGLPFPVLARGTIGRFSFRRDCGGLCMRSPFVGDARGFLPLDATVAWDFLRGILNSPGLDLSQIPAPTAAEVGTVLKTLNPATEDFDLVSPSAVRDIPAAKRAFNSTLETGYRGYLGRGISLALDVYHSTLTNVRTSLSVQTPNVFLDSASLEAYLVQANKSPAEAAAIAAVASHIPLGTVSPEQGDSTEILLIGRQGASAKFWGADLAVSAELGPHFLLSGTLSWASKDRVPGAGGFGDIVFNAPRSRAGLGITYRNSGSGLAAELRGRSVSSFPVESGVFSGRVESYTVLDASVSQRLPGLSSITVTLSVDNLLDQRHREFVGAPVLGRLVLGRVKAEF
jgi:iron complex outermembrane receptor protein